MPTGPTATRRKVFVLAGTHAEYHQHLREAHLTAKDAIFVRGPEQLYGRENPEVIRVGTWASLPRLGEIERTILERTRPT